VVASFTIRVSIKVLQTTSMADIYLGFMLLNNLNSDFIHNIVTERELNGDYTSVENLLIEYKPDWKAFKHLYLLVHSELVNRKVN
jgi:DNA polymerase III alpha subunit